MENLLYLFLITGTWLTWVRPIYNTLKQKQVKEWIEYWILMSTLVFLELNVFPEYSRGLAYHFVRTMSLFLLSERASVAATPKRKKMIEEKDSFDNIPCENFTEKMIHLEKFDEKTKVSILEKLLASWENSMLEFESQVDWVTKPKSLRGCTAYKFAMIIASGKYSDEKLVEMSKSQIPTLLVNMLQIPEWGERDNAILALCYFVDRCKKVRKVLFELHIFEILNIHLKQKNRPMCIRAIVAIYRRIFIDRDQAKEEFLRSKMTLDLIKLLESDSLDLVAETAEAIKELVMKTQTILNKAYLGILANQGLSSSVQTALNNHGSNNKLKIALRTIDTLIKSI